jgi:hypothetical protein
MSGVMAAAYVGVSWTTFARELKAGIWPKRNETLGHWDRLELDRASDRLSNPASGARERLLRRARGETDADAVCA